MLHAPTSVVLPRAQGTVPAGTEIIVTISQPVSSENAQVGQVIVGRVAENVRGAEAVIPIGSKAMLRVASVQSGYRSFPSRLWLKMVTVEVNEKTYMVSSNLAGQTAAASQSSDITYPAGTKMRFTLKSPLTIE